MKAGCDLAVANDGPQLPCNDRLTAMQAIVLRPVDQGVGDPVIDAPALELKGCDDRGLAPPDGSTRSVGGSSPGHSTNPSPVGFEANQKAASGCRGEDFGRLRRRPRRLRACGRRTSVVRLVGVAGSTQSSACPDERRPEWHEAWRGADERPRARLPKAALVASVTRWEGTASDACSDR